MKFFLKKFILFLKKRLPMSGLDVLKQSFKLENTIAGNCSILRDPEEIGSLNQKTSKEYCFAGDLVKLLL